MASQGRTVLRGVSFGYWHCSFALQTFVLRSSCYVAYGPHLEASGHVACLVLSMPSFMLAATGSIGLSTPGLYDVIWPPLLRFSEYCLRLSKTGCCRHLVLKIWRYFETSDCTNPTQRNAPQEELNVVFDMFNVGHVFCLVEAFGRWGSGRK